MNRLAAAKAKLPDWFRVVMHVPVGVAVVRLYAIGALLLAAFLFVGFMIYEISECVHHLNDGAYIDIAGCLAGLYLFAEYLNYIGG